MNRRINSNIYLVISMFLLVMVSAATAKTIFVDVKADGNNNGSSWANAYNHLQDALTATSSGDEILVAEGIYKPNQGKGIRRSNRDATFQLKTGVAIYGGFPSGGSNWEDSNPLVYETILSGDLQGDDVGAADDISKGENSYHVVTGTKTYQTAVLDGFTIIGGRASGRGGGGMYNGPGNPTVRNCTFKANWAKVGGGVYNTNISRPTFINCEFIGNSAKIGGGMRNGDSSPVLTNCKFIRNSAERGGAIEDYESNPTLTNCIFIGNSTADGAGDIWHNTGGGMFNQFSTPTLTNCTFSGNSARSGGAICNHRSSPKLTNCILWNNNDSNGVDESAQIYNYFVSKPIFNYCCIQGWTGDLDGTGNIGTDPLFVRNPDNGGDGWGNDPKTLGVDESANDDYGDLHLLSDSPCINLGDPSFIAGPNDLDIDGNPRIAGGQIDMGAFEYTYGEL